MQTESEVNTLEDCLGLIVLIVLALVIGTIIGGWVLSVMWGWFIVPIFHLPQLPIVYAIGIDLVVSFLTVPSHKIDTDKKGDAVRSITELLMTSIVTPLMYLGMGWMVLQFVGR